MKEVKNKPCGRKECAISTGICGLLTFGTGELDDLGYWEYPCNPCTEAHDKGEYLNIDQEISV